MSFSTLFRAAFIFALAQQLYGLAVYGETYDEPWHISWTERFLDTGNAERDSALNYHTTTPVLAANFGFLDLMWGSEPLAPETKLKTLRYWQIFWLSLLAAAALWCGTLVKDAELGYLFGAFLLLEPTLLAHSSVVTVDLACAASLLCQLGAALSYIAAPGIVAAVFLGITAGTAVAAKFTALIAVPTYVLLPLLARRAVQRRSFPAMWADMLLAGITASAVLAAYYGFAGLFRPLASVEWKSAAFAGLAAALPSLRLPLPEAALLGLDRTLAVANGNWNVVLLNRSFPRGTILYFPVLWLFKTPIALLMFTSWGWIRAVFSSRSFATPGRLFLLAQTSLLVLYFVFFFRIQVGYRHALAFLPFLFLIASLGWDGSRSRRGVFSLSVLAFLAAAEIVPFSGNLLSFTNLLVQPKAEAYRYFADSNLDWGQSRGRLSETVVKEYQRGAAYNPAHILPGRNLIDVNTFAGVWRNFGQHRWARAHLRPVESLEHSLLIFEVSASDFEKFLAAERALSPSELALSVCARTIEFRGLAPGSSETIPAAKTAVCVDAAERTVLRIRNTLQPIITGPRTAAGCSREQLGPKGEAWFVLEPGKYEFCVENNSDLVRMEILSGAAGVFMPE